MAEIHDQFDTILILDFGSQVCFRTFSGIQLLTRRIAVQSLDYTEMS